jgi:hypothetical protein
MKKLFLLLALVQFVMICSCRKILDGHGGQPGDITHEVTFQFSGLNHTVGQPNVGMQAEPLQNYITQLSVIAYNAKTGSEVKRLTQFASQSDFGKVIFKLDPAQYNFIAVGSQSAFGINQFYKPDTIPVYLPYTQATIEYLQDGPDPYWRHYETSDTFLSRKAVNINNNQTVEMVMERIVGKLEFEVNDAPNFKVSEIYDEKTAFKVSADSLLHRVKNYSFPEYTAVDGKISLYILNTTGTLAIESGVWLHPLYIQDIRVYKNKTTLVKAKVLTGEYTITVQ